MVWDALTLLWRHYNVLIWYRQMKPFRLELFINIVLNISGDDLVTQGAISSHVIDLFV